MVLMQVGLLPLPKNIKLVGWKRLKVANTQAYYAIAIITTVKRPWARTNYLYATNKLEYLSLAGFFSLV
jgi:hypothetical protein